MKLIDTHDNAVLQKGWGFEIGSRADGTYKAGIVTGVFPPCDERPFGVVLVRLMGEKVDTAYDPRQIDARWVDDSEVETHLEDGRERLKYSCGGPH